MGLAKLELKEPNQFLKKGEGVKKPIPKCENVCFQEKRPQIPERPTTGISQKQTPNIIKRNIKSAQALKPKKPDKYIVDYPDGHKFEYEDCKYIFGKYYGCVPQYLAKRIKNIKHAEEKYKNELENKKHSCKLLSEDQVKEMLKVYQF